MAVNKSLENSIVEIRDEQMVDPTSSNANKNPTRRTAHFLRPSLNSNSSPPLPPKAHSFPVTSRPKIIFLSCSQPLEGWQTWVQDLEPTHALLWRNVGIFDAVKASTYHIAKNSDLIFQLAERWCPKTNTFVFPWGEATLTLEDVFVLGGFSPLGESVFRVSSSGDNVKQVENKLIESHRELANSRSIVSIVTWQKHFMGCGNEIEHAGFLALWLARHVFPSKTAGVITRLVFSVAARLSCGIKFDLASAVLASVYKDLTFLKRKIFSSDVRTLRLGSQLQFVQVWAWRFPSLGPVPRMINLGETRLACWDNPSRKTCCEIADIGMSLDSARDTFRWRPYAMSLENWSVPRFYADLEAWVIVDSDEEWKIVARFLLVCLLTGLDCVEGYNPNRVALQFGYDQDIPDYIDSCEPGLLECEKNLNGLKLYIPHRLREGDVTYRYSNWWNSLNLVANPLIGCKRKGRTKKRVKKLSKIYKGANDFVGLDIGARGTKNPAEKLQSIEDVSSQHLVQDGVVNETTFVLNMQSGLSLEEGTSMGEERRNEARRNKFPHSKAGSGECNKYLNAGTSQTQPMTSAETLIQHEINILRSEAAETEQNVYSNQGADCLKLSRVLLEREKVGDADCGQRHLHLVNEVARASVTSPLLRREGGSEKFQHNTGGQDKEQIFIRQDVVIGESSESLEQADKARNETSTDCNIGSIGVASEVNALSLLLEYNELDKADIQVDVQVGVSSAEENIDLNPFAALCRDYESRISELEREISALSAVNVTSSLV